MAAVLVSVSFDRNEMPPEGWHTLRCSSCSKLVACLPDGSSVRVRCKCGAWVVGVVVPDAMIAYLNAS